MKLQNDCQVQSFFLSKRLLVPVFLTALFVLSIQVIYAQDVDYSGEWILNEAESDLGEGMRWVTKAIKVTREGNNFELLRTRTGRDGQERTSTENLTLDGETTVNERGNRSVVSSVNWSEDGKSMTITSKSTFNREGQTFEMTSTEVWNLDEKGKVLSIEYSGSTPRGERKATLVYDKK